MASIIFCINDFITWISTGNKRFVFRFNFKGKVHPEVKLVLIKAEKWEKHINEGLTKIHQRITELWNFKVLNLWRHMRAAPHMSCDINSIKCRFLRNLKMILPVHSIYYQKHYFIQASMKKKTFNYHEPLKK